MLDVTVTGNPTSLNTKRVDLRNAGQMRDILSWWSPGRFYAVRVVSFNESDTCDCHFSFAFLLAGPPYMALKFGKRAVTGKVILRRSLLVGAFLYMGVIPIRFRGIPGLLLPDQCFVDPAGFIPNIIPNLA